MFSGVQKSETTEQYFGIIPNFMLFLHYKLFYKYNNGVHTFMYNLMILFSSMIWEWSKEHLKLQ